MSYVSISKEAQGKLLNALGGDTFRLLDRHNWKIFCLDGMDEHDGYEHMRRGGCMLCGEDLGEDTLILIDEDGILGIWCGGDCLRDMHTISFLENLLSDMTARLLPDQEE